MKHDSRNLNYPPARLDLDCVHMGCKQKLITVSVLMVILSFVHCWIKTKMEKGPTKIEAFGSAQHNAHQSTPETFSQEKC